MRVPPEYSSLLTDPTPWMTGAGVVFVWALLTCLVIGAVLFVGFRRGWIRPAKLPV